MSERFVTTSPDGSRDALYERRSALSRDLLGDPETDGVKKRRRADKATRPTKSPRQGRRSGIRVPELAFGLVLIIGGALAASLLAAKKTETIEVVAAVADMARGHEITAADLVAVETEARLAHSMMRTTEAAALLGKVLAVDLAAGSPILPGTVHAAPTLQVGEEVVALSVEVGDAPTSLAVGDPVRVALVPDPSLSTDTAITEFDQPTVVWDIEEPSDASPDYVISLKVPTDFLAKAAVADRVKIALVAGRGEAAS